MNYESHMKVQSTAVLERNSGKNSSLNMFLSFIQAKIGFAIFI